ncbi:MT-A70 family methyltransferase [Alishewanella sp. WH16-1]|uniref:MT-A70 family methyltransferase n=1 Tax=Alishewanella sp. WH16-1 TaxID=1651088 RepID=UPI00070ACCA6|nr:MT-A70 family methyltransferase [Alishewanella sp. WH16-1]
MTKKYNIIYADPPWQFNSVKSGGSMKSGAAAKYNVMSLEQLKALDVPALCEKDCVLIMWYVSSQPQEALDLVKAWGFTIKNMNAFIWRKLSTNLIPHFGMGYWTRGGAECALLAVRSKPKSVCKSIRQVRDEPVGEHSEKPGIFRDDIVKLCGDLPRLEMFARTAPAGWDVFGNEVESSVDIAGNEPATKCVEETGTDIDGGTKALTIPTVEFTSEQIADQLASGKLPFTGDHLALMLQLDGMFGKRGSYTTSQIRAAVLAFDEPGMVTKAGEVVAAVQPEATETTEEQTAMFEHFDEAMAAGTEPVPEPEAEPAPAVITSKTGKVKSDDAEVFFDQLQIPQNVRTISAKCPDTGISRSGYAIWAKGYFSAGKINGIGIRTTGDFKKGYFYEPTLVVFYQGKDVGEYTNWPEALAALDALLQSDPEAEPQGEAHPFFTGFYGGNATYAPTVPDKVAKVKTFTLEQCQAALKLPHLQSTVVAAVQARIRKLHKEQQHENPISC